MSVMAYLELVSLSVLLLPSVSFMLDSFLRSSCRFLQLLLIMLLLLLRLCLITVVWLMHISVIIRLFLFTTLFFLLLQTLLTNMVSLYILNVVAMKSDNKIGFSEDFIAKFHPYAPTYDPEKDIMQVEPALAIDLKEVYITGIVPAGAPSFVDRYNDCDDPNSIVGRPRNDFDADRLVSGVNEAIREAKQSEQSKG